MNQEDMEHLIRIEELAIEDRLPEISGDTIKDLMRFHGVTIRTLSERMGVTIKRVRHVREYGCSGRARVRDWVEAITR